MSSMNILDLGLWVGLAAVVILHRFVLSNRAQSWLGAIVPALWVIAVVIFTTKGAMSSFQDWLLGAIGLLVLLVFWGHGQTTRKERLKRENERINALNARNQASEQLTP